MEKHVSNDRAIYGCDIEEFRRSVDDSFVVKHKLGGYPMVAMSILSDAQELMAMGRPERARQEINKAKWVIQEYLTKPAPDEKSVDDTKTLPPIRYRVKVKGGEWHFTDRLPAPCDMDSIEAIEEAGERLSASADARIESSSRTIEELQSLWAQLADVPVDNDGCLDADFLHFENGTPREDVWVWFEKQNPEFSVAEMQRGGSRHRPN